MGKNYGILAFGLFTVCASVAADAEAAPSLNNTMICSVTHYPQDDGHGDFGYLRVEMLNQGVCGNGLWWFCSTGATHKYCHPDYTYRERALINLHERLVEVARDGDTIGIYSDTTGEGTNRKGMYVNFYD
jgi:hypothetical protein